MLISYLLLGKLSGWRTDHSYLYFAPFFTAFIFLSSSPPVFTSLQVFSNLFFFFFFFFQISSFRFVYLVSLSLTFIRLFFQLKAVSCKTSYSINNLDPVNQTKFAFDFSYFIFRVVPLFVVYIHMFPDKTPSDLFSFSGALSRNEVLFPFSFYLNHCRSAGAI